MTAKEALTAVCEAWERLDADALAVLFTADGVYEDPLKPEALHGVAAIRDGNAPAMAVLADCAIELERVLADDSVAFAEGVFRSALREGGRLDFPFALLVEMDGARIRRVAEYFDTRPLLP
jgi:ketosteroid isomerase-like protein